jgi:hypothetical protein
MYFTREALEQSTAEVVSEYRSRRYTDFPRLLDLGCSIGGDTLALAAQAPTVGIDRDPLRLSMAQVNADSLGLADRAEFVQADLTAGLPLAVDPGWAAFFDPARRAGAQRVFSVHDYQPPLSAVLEWQKRLPALGVKISPGVDLDELRQYPAEIEFISVSGDLKEAVLWFGPLRSAGRRATLLPGEHTLAAEFDDIPAGEELLSEPRSYLYEPDSAVLRAGLVRRLATQLGAAQLDPDIAYLTGDRPVEAPFARRWKVEAWFPFSLKRLRQALRERSVNRVVVKKRGSPLDPQEVIRSLKLKPEPGAESTERVVFLTHLRGRPIVVLCWP